MPTQADIGVTPDSLKRAKAHQLEARLEVTRLTGLVFQDDGHIDLLDEIALGLRMANWIWSAVHGSRGEWRRVH